MHRRFGLVPGNSCDPFSSSSRYHPFILMAHFVFFFKAVSQNEHQPLFVFFLCDQDVEVEKQSHFAIVNMKTATTAAVSG